MFTGLIEEVGVVRRLDRRGDGGRLSILSRAVLEDTRLGDSIAVSGACLTVVDLTGDGFEVDCMPETLAHTTLGRVTHGTLVNLERSLAVGGRLGGHLVLGHVDAVAEVLAVRQKGTASEVRLSLPETIRGCVAAKGSIALDGISLTVMGVGDRWFEVGIIPHTLKETTLRTVTAGMEVNVEADVLARYVQRAVHMKNEPNGDAGMSPSGGLTETYLREHGFA